jgi:hypothetical protein
MKSLGFIFTIILLTSVGYVKAFAGGPGVDANDTTVNFKSNIVIFKMIPSPAGNSANTNGSLKKAGKVARTSNSPHTSIENILYKKKGI